MGQILRPDSILNLTYLSSVVTLPAGSRCTIGGQQYTNSSALNVTLTGLSASTLYYVYVVLSGGVQTLVYSTNANSVGPAGYTAWRLVGAFYTTSGSVFSAFLISGTNTINRSFLSGSGTWTPLFSSLALGSIKLRMVGGGGGGAGGGVPGQGNGTAGGNTTFGTSLLTANGGATGRINNDDGGVGGTCTINSPAIGFSLVGGKAEGGAAEASLGGSGASTVFGGASGRPPQGASNAIASAANTGAGGAGGSSKATAGNAGSGGGAGGYIEAIITSPSSSYTYSVGTSGGGGSAGTNGGAGGAGGSGIIIIEENYQLAI